MIGAIVFARVRSTRLPSKVLIQVQGKSILQHIIERVSRSRYVQKVVLATTTASDDDVIEILGHRLGVDIFRGSELDVLDRCYRAAIKFSIDPIVRVTADDPFKDPGVMDKIIELYLDAKGKYDMVCNSMKPTFPEGLDVEVFSFQSLEKTWKTSTSPQDRQHVTKYMYDNPEQFRIFNVANVDDLSRIRLTLDTEEDLQLVTRIYDALYPKGYFDWTEIVAFLKSKPELFEINKNVKKSGRYVR